MPNVRVIVEYEPQSRIEGEIQQMPAGFAVTEFAALVGGTAQGRTTPQDITIFDSVGFALEDFSALRFLHGLLQEDRHRRQIDLIPQLADPKDLYGGTLGGGTRARLRLTGQCHGQCSWTDRRAHRRRRRHARRLHGPGGAARRRLAVRRWSRHGLEVHRPRQPRAARPIPWQPPADGYRHLTRGRRLEPRWCTTPCTPSSPADGLPILLGGDHCSGIGSISAVARHCRETGKKLRVLWLDAHADFNTNVLTPSGNIHGMPVACLCGYGPQELIEIGGKVPAHQPEVRSARSASAASTPGEKRLVHEAGPRGLRHALHRRDGHAPHDGAGAARRSTRTPTCT